MSFAGSRVTDAVNYYKKVGFMRGAVREVRRRRPEKLRWRAAISVLSQSAVGERGRERMRIEEPIREMVLDVEDEALRINCVLDARRYGVDYDRGEVLPVRTMADVRRYAFLTEVDLRQVERYMPLPADFERRVDSPGLVIVGRAWAHYHRQRAQKLWATLPSPEATEQFEMCVDATRQSASQELDRARRWQAFAKAVESTGT